MSPPLRVLLVEDLEVDAALVVRELRRGDWSLTWKRVETEDALREALLEGAWDIVLSDFGLPAYDGMAALAFVREHRPDLPFILVSGTIGEETAVLAIKAGAQDYILKDNLKRLNTAVERALKEAEERRDRLRAELALTTSEARFRTLVTSMQDVVFTLDQTLHFTEIYGALPVLDAGECVLGKRPREVFAKDVATAYEESAWRALRGGLVVFEWSVGAPPDQRYFQTSLSPLRDGADLKGLVGVTRETTEQRRAEAQLFVSDRMASVGTLAAGVAHEINNPLAAVLANLDFAQEDTERLITSFLGDPVLRHHVEKVRILSEPLRDAREAADGVRQIIRDLKIFSRAGDEEHRGPVDVRRVLDSSARMAWNEIRHRAHLTKEFEADVPLVHGNESRLGQVFLNLLINAAQAIPEGRASENEIHIAVRHDDARVCIEVRDTGGGMPPEVERRLFTPFFTTKPPGVGTGLGLSICHRIVTSLGGTIEVDTAPGKGTTMRVVLPALLSAVAPPQSLPRVARASSRRGHLLVVDDEPLVGRAIRRMLSREHEVTVVTNVADALALLPLKRASDDKAAPTPPFDLILCDVMMPDMTGMDLFAAVNEASPEIAARIVFLTGGAFTPAARQFLDTNKNPRLEKPLDTNQLRAFVNARTR